MSGNLSRCVLTFEVLQLSNLKGFYMYRDKVLPRLPTMSHLLLKMMPLDTLI